jgi:hypothetical protein
MIPCLWVLLALQQEDPVRSLEKRLSEAFDEVHVVLKGEVWFGSFAGSGRLNKWFGTKLDREKDSPRIWLDRQAQLGETEPIPSMDVQLHWENDQRQYKGVRIQYRRGTWSESGAVDRSFVVDGTIIAAGSPFKSRLVRDDGSIHAVAGLHVPEIPIDIGGWAGCQFHRERFRMETSSGPLEDGAGGLNAILGVHLELHPFPFLFAAGELSFAGGFGVPESQAMISAGLVWEQFRLEAGYRHLWSWWDLDPAFRLSLGGPFVGLSVRF